MASMDSGRLTIIYFESRGLILIEEGGRQLRFELRFPDDLAVSVTDGFGFLISCLKSGVVALVVIVFISTLPVANDLFTRTQGHGHAVWLIGKGIVVCGYEAFGRTMIIAITPDLFAIL